jgi:outer membrane protein with beta-barrel domain
MRFKTAAGVAGVLTVLVVSTSGAQAASRPAGFARSVAAVDAARTMPVQGSAPASKWTIYGGIATGDTGFDLGFALQASYKTTPAGWPVALRIDPFLGRWSGGDEFGGSSFDFSMTMFGVQANAVYDFPSSGDMNWFVLGGLGIFYSSFSFDDDVSGFDADASSTDLGIGIGGGLNFGKRFVIEAQFKDIGGFSTIPILFGIRL